MKHKMKRYQDGGDVIELQSKTGKNEAIGDDVRERAMAAMAARELGAEEKKATPKAEPKAAAPKAEAKAEPKAEPKEEPKKKASTTIPSTFGKVALPKSFSASGGNTEPKKSTAKFSSPSISLPDPLAKFKKMASGGKVSSASSRADGCATKGKTKGRMV